MKLAVGASSQTPIGIGSAGMNVMDLFPSRVQRRAGHKGCFSTCERSARRCGAESVEPTSQGVRARSAAPDIGLLPGGPSIRPAGGVRPDPGPGPSNRDGAVPVLDAQELVYPPREKHGAARASKAIDAIFEAVIRIPPIFTSGIDAQKRGGIRSEPGRQIVCFRN